MCTGRGEPVAIVNHCNLVRVNLNYAFYYVEVDKTGPKKNGCKIFTGYQFISPFYVHLPRTYVVWILDEQTSKKPSDWEVHIGEHSLHREEGKEQKLDVKQILIHPNYKPSNSSHPGDNDIGKATGSLFLTKGRILLKYLLYLRHE